MSTPAAPSVRVNVYLEPKLLNATRILADRRGSTMSDLFRTALRQYVVAELKREREETELLLSQPQQAEKAA